MSAMTLTKEQIMSAALQLPPAEREALADELLLSIGETDRQSIEAAWVAEARRRDADFQAGNTGAKPAEQVISRLLGKARA
jgi:putative addiction module component (TIGR02574 family)